MSDDHSQVYIDSEGEQRCSTCDKWLEPGYYTLRDHRASMLSDVVTEWTTE